MTVTRNTSRKTAALRSRRITGQQIAALLFLAPALLVLLVFLIYPVAYTIVRSTFDATGQTFVGLDNYRRVFTEPRMLVALRNNAIWVAVVPAAVTSLGLIFAVLAERVKWSSAFKVALFMPLVVSGVAAGVTFRFVYAGDPNIGLANAVIGAVVESIKPPGPYPNARPSVSGVLIQSGEAWITGEHVPPGTRLQLGMLGIPPHQMPDIAREAKQAPEPSASAITGTVWMDFAPGAPGNRGQPDSKEKGLPGIKIEALRDGSVVASAITDPNGRFTLQGLNEGSYQIRLSESNFRKPFGGVYWLGSGLIIPSLIGAYIWINTGFALIVIGAGLAAINRDYLDAARVEGANEWQVFRFITVPMLRQVLLVVMVKITISVLKVFDLVMVVAPESVQADATVLALEMWRASFGGMRDFGLGSALATLLFLLILPIMAFNVRRFRLGE